MACCGVAAVRDGEAVTVVWGTADAATGRAANAETLFHICSCSKAFTAAGFAELVACGAVSWDAAIQDVVPEFELADSWIGRHCSFRDLAGMRLGLDTNGIAEWGFRSDAPVLARLSRAKAMPFAAPFRDRFSYSNLGYIALALASARLSGMTYADYLAQSVFVPNRLAGATLEPGTNLALPHMPHASGLSPVPELTGDNSQGSARVHLTVADAAAWLEFQLRCVDNGERESHTEMFRPQSIVRPAPDAEDGLPRPWAYGFGWHLSTFRRRRIFNHGGGGRGWRTMALLDPEKRSGVMVMAAHEGVGAEALALSVLDLVSGRKPAGWVRVLEGRAARETAKRHAATDLRNRPVPKTVREPSAVAGVYENGVTGHVRIENASDGSLHFTVRDAPAFSARLNSEDDGIFMFQFDNPALRTMPHDPLFQLRFVTGADRLQAETTYFGTLLKTG